MHRLFVMSLVAGLLVICGGDSYALINPTFTPVHLVAQADLILVLKVQPPDAADHCVGEVVKAIKGKAPDKSQTIGLSQVSNRDQATAIKDLIGKAPGAQAILFVGKKEMDESMAAMLHVGGKWVVLDAGKEKNTWEAQSLNGPMGKMEAVWAGGTDMLLKLCELLVDRPETVVPVESGVTWSDKISLGTVPGKISLAQAVDLAGKGENALFIASDAGDRLFQWDRNTKGFEDLTARRKLGSKSVASAWGGFTGSGRVDLASWDGKRLTIWAQAADGSFAPTVVDDVPADACLGLVAIDAGVPARAGLLWTTPTAPVLLVPDRVKPGAFICKPLTIGAAAPKDLGPVGMCLVADFHGDGLADVIQVCAKGSLLFTGKARGEFAEGVGCDIAAGSGRTAAFVGDWDMDGRLDVFTTSADGCHLWQNVGGGNLKFEDRIGLSGEAAYIPQPKAIGGNVCDFNNDGRQDLFIYYAEGAGPQLFFNRGFRSLGHGHTVDLQDNNLLDGIRDGQQAGVVADFNGDAAQDLVVVLLSGEVVFFPQKLDADAALAARVALAPGGPYAGPVTVTATSEGRSLGAWTVLPGASEAFFGSRDATTITINWKVPGGEMQKKDIALGDEAVRFVIPPGK